MNCGQCQGSLTFIELPPPRRTFSADPEIERMENAPRPAGALCGTGSCPLHDPCEVCGAGWVAKECDAIPDYRASIGTMRQVMKAGSEYIVCANGHKRLTKAVAEESYTDALAARMRGL